MRDDTLRSDREVSRMLKETGNDRSSYRMEANTQREEVRLIRISGGISGYQVADDSFYEMVPRAQKASVLRLED